MEDVKPTSLPNFRLRKQEDLFDQFTGFISAKQKMLNDVERLERKQDAAKFLIEARMDLWDVRHPYHYFDTAFDEWEIEKDKRMANLTEEERQAES